jgi:hypothetical protein
MATAKSLASKLPGFFTVDEARELSDDNKFVITFADVIEIGQGAKAEEKPVLGFADTRKQLVLNKSRCEQLGVLFGAENLIGKSIRLKVVNIQGREQIAVVSPE